MKRLFVLLLVFALLITAAAPAAARTFTSLGELQQFIEKHSPADIAATGEHYADLEGTITELAWCGTGNHWQMLLQVEDPRAIPPVGSDAPQLIVHFRLHKDSPPFQVGDTITIFGSVNSLYSSVVLPWILADFINGSDDF